MRVVKRFFSDENTALVSGLFDKVITKTAFHIPFSKIEFHIRDYDTTLIEEDKAVICMDYNNLFVREKDPRGISTLIRFELVRLMLRTGLPREIDDVVVGREMIKMGFADDLFYVYYTSLMRTQPTSLLEYVRASIPWITFRGVDNYNSSVLKELLLKVQRKKHPQATRMLNNMCNGKLEAAEKEYNKIFAACPNLIIQGKQ